MSSTSDTSEGTPREGVWHEVAERDELPEGRVRTVHAADKSSCLTQHDGVFGLLDNSEPGTTSTERRAGEWPVRPAGLVHPNVAALVERRGGLGLRVYRRDPLEDAQRHALADDGPATVWISTDAELVV